MPIYRVVLGLVSRERAAVFEEKYLDKISLVAVKLRATNALYSYSSF